MSSSLGRLSDLVQYAKANPGKVTLGHSGAGTIGFVMMQQLMRDAKITLTDVPYKSGADILTALMSNTVDLMVTGAPTIMGSLKGGSVRVLAMTSEQRWPGAEEVPTMAEQGVNVVNYLWFGLMAPKGTPASVINYLHKNSAAVMDDPKVKEALTTQAAQAVAMGPAELTRLMQDDARNWAQMLKAANITPQ